jgi:phosphoglycerate dehydrogenase-like enzyme
VVGSTSALIVLPQAAHIQREYLRRLREALPEVRFELVDHHSAAVAPVAEADILISFGVQLTDAVFAAARKLRWVQALGSGVDGIVDQPSLAPDVLVSNMHGLHGAPCAEAALSAMFGLARNVRRTIRSQAEARWDRFPVSLLDGKTVCAVGVGVIAEALAPRCAALGMRVTGVSGAPREVAHMERVYPRAQLAAAAAEADFLVVLAPYTKQNHHLIGADVLRAMKPGASLVNIARGGVIDEAALLEALRAGALAGAALDVFSVEPLPADHPFWSMENVLVTPHLAGYHDRYPEFAIPILIHNIRRFLAGDVAGMKNVVRLPAGA